jgi:predicted dehydrogenase
MKNILKVAIAGAGMVTYHHLIAWSRIPKVEIVAIYNRTLSKALKRAEEFHIPKIYSNLEEMLEKERPDAIDIAVSPEVHKEFIQIAASYGVAILCQKPLAPNLKEAEEIVEEIGGRVRFMVHENWRFRPPYRQVAKWITEGKTGPIREFKFSARSSGLITKNKSGIPLAIDRQPFFAHMPRFIILELLIHHLDTARFLLGEMEVLFVQASKISPDIIGEDVAQIVLKTQDGAIGMVSGNLSAPGFPPLPQDRLELIGEYSSIIFDGECLTLLNDQPETLQFPFEETYQSSYNNAIAHFVEGLLLGKPFETNLKDNLKTLKLVEEAYSLMKMV